MGELEYREEVLKILKEFRDSGVMTFTEVTDRIMAIPIPKEKKNPYEGMATREDLNFHWKNRFLYFQSKFKLNNLYILTKGLQKKCAAILDKINRSNTKVVSNSIRG